MELHRVHPFEVAHHVPEGGPAGSWGQGLILGWSWGNGNQWPVCVWESEQDLITNVNPDRNT